MPGFTIIKRIIKWIFGTIAVVVIVTVVGLLALLAILWREHKTEITLPLPTGHFAVGRTPDTWVNDAETDDLAPSPGTKREVIVWIWYPASSATPAAPAESLPAPWQLAQAQYSGV